jgi:hypothetical protein
MHDKGIAWTRMCVPIISNYDHVNLQNKCDLDLWKGTWFFAAPQCCHVIDICAKFLKIPQCRTKLQSGHDCCVSGDHGQTDLSLSHDTSSWCGSHLCQVILKSFHALQSYSPTWMCIFKLFSTEWVPSNYKCDLDLEGRDRGLGRDVFLVWLTFMPSYFKILWCMTKLQSRHEWCTY